MIEIDTLSRNKNIFNPNKDLQNQGIGILDLTRASLSFGNINLKISQFYRVPEDAQMRPDLICLQGYGNLTNIGSLMKTNGISNPFSIDTGTLLAIPDADGLDAAFDQKKMTISSGNTTDNPNTAFRKSQENKAFKTSDSRKKFIEQQSKAKNPIAEPLPPNLLQDGEVQTLITPSVIALGPNASAAGPSPNGLPL
jgi:hypothetical protein